MEGGAGVPGGQAGGPPGAGGEPQTGRAGAESRHPAATASQVTGGSSVYHSTRVTRSARRELFESIAKEVRDEVNLGLEQQTRPELLGIVYNLQHAGRLALEFLITTTLHSHQVPGRCLVVVTLTKPGDGAVQGGRPGGG